MTITRVLAETELVERQGERMSIVGLAITIVGANADLQSPMASALRKMGYSASSPVTDSDLSIIPDDEIEEFYDRAELRLLQNIKGNNVLVDITTGPRSKKLGQLAQELEKDIQLLANRVYSEYEGAGSLSAGAISLDFQEPYPGNE